MDENKLNKIKQRVLGKPQCSDESRSTSTVNTDSGGDADIIKYVLICAFSICSIYAIVDIIKGIF